MQFSLVNILRRAMFSGQGLQSLCRVQRRQGITTPKLKIRFVKERIEKLRDEPNLGRALRRPVGQFARALDFAQLPHAQGKE
jgi:hypothetical protein